MDDTENFSDKIRDLEKRILAENAESTKQQQQPHVNPPSFTLNLTRHAQKSASCASSPAGDQRKTSLSDQTPNFTLASPSLTRKKPKPLVMNATVGPAMGRAMSPDMDGDQTAPSLLGFRDSFRLTRLKRFELALPSLPPGVRVNCANALVRGEDGQVEYEQKLGEILKKTNILTLRGRKYDSTTDDLENLGELGHGTCGTVVKMRFRKTGDVLAVKIMRKSGNKEENKRIIRDLDVVLKSHDCPYIVTCVGCFVTDSEVWICMEMMATCLDKLLKRTKTPLPEKILGKMSVSVVKALHYLKEKHGVIHRDVKPSNILLDSRGTFKLCDFGISGRLVDSKAKTQCGGCAAYLAPERIIAQEGNRPDYDIRDDVWSFGISLMELATGELPYNHCQTDFEVLANIVNDPPPALPSHRGFSMDFCSFVKDCLTKDAKRRPKYKKLLEHPFVIRYELLNVDVAGWVKQVYSPLMYHAIHSELTAANSALPPKPVFPTTSTRSSNSSLFSSTPTPSPLSGPSTPLSGCSSQVASPPARSSPSSSSSSWFVKPSVGRNIFRSSASVPSTAPLPRKQYNIIS